MSIDVPGRLNQHCRANPNSLTHCLHLHRWFERHVWWGAQQCCWCELRSEPRQLKGDEIQPAFSSFQSTVDHGPHVPERT